MKRSQNGLKANVGFIRYVNSGRQTQLVPYALALWMLFLCNPMAVGQDGVNSENGWHLSPHGTIKVLMLFVELEYDVNPQDDPQPNGHRNWQPGQLPVYADDVFDHEILNEPRGRMTRYYDFCSLGNLRVLGDYYHKTITLKESEVGRLNLTSIKRAVSELLAEEEFTTGNGSDLASFDQWKDGIRVGMPKVNEPDEELSFDHVMMFLRNFHLLGKDNGSAAGHSFGVLFGGSSDTHSQFNGGHDLPEQILRHEFSHLLLGSNNFHCCGGGSTGNTSYFIPGIYGWGLMGFVNSSFHICNAWDRHRMGWKNPEKQYLLSAFSEEGKRELGTDLHADSSTHQGRYLLRDFATTGDALRIELPHIPAHQFRQYLWIENHQGYARNGVEFDRFRYDDREEMTTASPGLYMMIQVDKDQKTGSETFGGFASYLRPVLADGRFDVQWTNDSVPGSMAGNLLPVHYKPASMENPLTGSQDMESISFNKNPEDSTLEYNDILDPWVEMDAGGKINHMTQFGHERHAFRLGGNSRIGIGTNPSSASLVSYVSGKSLPRSLNKKNNHSTYLNGVSVEILEERDDGSILVDVRFDDTTVKENTRWCSDTVVVSNNPHHTIDLELAKGTRLLVDHGETATRRTDPTLREGKQVFVSPTTLVLKEGTHTILRKKSRLTVDNCSEIIVQSGARLTIEKGAKVILTHGAEMHIESGAEIEGRMKAVKTQRGGRVIYR